MVFWTYNFIFFALIILLVGTLTYSMARFVCGLSRWIESLVLLLGFLSIAGLLYYFASVSIKNTEKLLSEKLQSPNYSVEIMPKLTPYSEDLVLEFVNAESRVKIHMKIKSKINVDEIVSQIKDKQSPMDKILQ